jgi:predicted nucleic acid-binding protein
MTSFLVDANCMVAAVSGWHEHRQQASEEIDRRRNRGEELVLAAHSFIEAYSVLTRLPPPKRLPPSRALELLEANFTPVMLVTLDASEYRDLLRAASTHGIVGGRIYDAIIAECALKANAAVLLTFNATHFLPFAQRGIEIIVPG